VGSKSDRLCQLGSEWLGACRQQLYANDGHYKRAG
jgi:hypothetical protein